MNLKKHHVAFEVRDTIFLSVVRIYWSLGRSRATTKSSCRVLLLLLWMALVFTTASGQTDQHLPGETPAPAPTIEQVQTHLSAGQPDAAIELLFVIPKSPSNERLINHFWGLAYYQKGDHARAAEHLLLAIANGQEGSQQYRQAVQLLGLSDYFLGRIKEAIPYLEQVKRWSPENVEVAYVLGTCYIRAQNADGAREAFARLFGVSPGSASAYLMNAQMMMRQQVEALAEKELHKALELDPKLPQAHFLLGEIAIYNANIDLGIELLKKEIAINPAFAMAYYRLGEAYTRQLKWDDAMAPLQKSIWLNPFFSGPFIVLGKVYLKKGDLPNAESILRRALRMDPNNFSGHHLLAQVLQQANRMDEAKREFELADRLRTESEK